MPSLQYRTDSQWISPCNADFDDAYCGPMIPPVPAATLAERIGQDAEVCRSVTTRDKLVHRYSDSHLDVKIIRPHCFSCMCGRHFCASCMGRTK